MGCKICFFFAFRKESYIKKEKDFRTLRKMSHIIKREWVLEFVHFLLFGENTMLLESGA
jgi:hypothetical protein